MRIKHHIFTNIDGFDWRLTLPFSLLSSLLSSWPLWAEAKRISKRKKKQKMERQRYIVLYGENFWSFGIVINLWIGFWEFVIIVKEGTKVWLALISLIHCLFVVHRRVRKYIPQRRQNRKQKTMCFFVLHRIWENF